MERIRLFIGVFVQTATQHRLRVGAREELWLALANQVVSDHEQFGEIRLNCKVIVEEIKSRLELSRHFFLFLSQFCRVEGADRNLKLAKDIAGNDLVGVQEAQDVIHLGLQAVIGEQSTDTLLVRRDAGNNISALGCELSGQGIEQEDSFIYAHVVVSGFLYPVDMILEVRGERTTLGISEETLEEEVPEPFRRKQ